jgi:hypothetical protein
MKKIGILFGQERSFPMAFIEKINSKGIEGITAEAVRIDKAPQGEPTGYAVNRGPHFAGCSVLPHLA